MIYKQHYLFPLIAGIALFTSCGNKKDAQQQQGPPPAIPVTVTEVKTTAASYNDEYPGTVEALNEITITSQVSGYVTGIFFKD
nr:efflux RND transporter periplasmic adaptor subunit [Bacteroidota bacterium]